MSSPFPDLSRLPNPLEALPAAINHLLTPEPWARAQLAPHAGKTVHLVMVPFNLRLTVSAEGTCKLADAASVAANVAEVRIELPWAALPQALAAGRDGANAALMRQLKLEGDADFAHAISAVANNLRWDVENDLSKLVGDVAATRMTAAARKLGSEIGAAQRKFADNVSEYLLEENPQLVRPRNVDELMEAIRVLRDDLARLEKRVDRL